jgi:hypothetical protein
MATDEKRTYPEGEWLAAEVRDLATAARRILAAGQCGPREIAIVSRRVARLLARMDGDPPTPIRRWLENLQRQVRGLGQSLGPWKSNGSHEIRLARHAWCDSADLPRGPEFTPTERRVADESRLTIKGDK